VGDGCCDDIVVFEDVGSSRSKHTDFEAVVDEDVAGEEIRVHLRNMKYILQLHRPEGVPSICDGDVE
jgi:hypothetical protein